MPPTHSPPHTQTHTRSHTHTHKQLSKDFVAGHWRTHGSWCFQLDGRTGPTYKGRIPVRLCLPSCPNTEQQPVTGGGQQLCYGLLNIYHPYAAEPITTFFLHETPTVAREKGIKNSTV